MTTDRFIEVMSTIAYDFQNETLPTVGRATPSDRELRGARKLYMPKGKKSLNEWRKLRGLDTKELGEVSGIGTTVRGHLYKGHVPRADVAERLAATLGVEVSQIQWGKVEEEEVADLPPMPKSPPYNPREGTPVISDEQMNIAVQWAKAGRSKKDVYEAMGVSHQTFYTAMERYEAKHGPVEFKQRRLKPKATQKPRKGPATEAQKEKPSSRSRKAVKDVL